MTESPPLRSIGRQLIALLAASMVLIGCGRAGTRENGATAPDIPFETEGELAFLLGDQVIDSIRIEIADTDSARARGLMQRTGLPPRSGMLFVFDREEPQSFWMANTPLSLDMFFVDADSQIVSIRKYTRPLSPESVVSEAPAQYVIETAAGFADSRGITVGSRVSWQRFSPASADTAASD